LAFSALCPHHPGYENLELRQCEHPGGTCKKLVHHLCAINWGESKVVTDDIGYTCREHTPAYIEISRQFNPQPEASETGSDHSDNNSHENQNEKTISLDDTDDDSPNAKNYSKMTEEPRGRKLPICAARKNQDSDPPTNARSGSIFPREVNTRSAQTIIHSISVDLGAKRRNSVY
jgi:hypothetical protein